MHVAAGAWPAQSREAEVLLDAHIEAVDELAGHGLALHIDIDAELVVDGLVGVVGLRGYLAEDVGQVAVCRLGFPLRHSIEHGEVALRIGLAVGSVCHLGIEVRAVDGESSGIDIVSGQARCVRSTIELSGAIIQCYCQFSVFCQSCACSCCGEG